MRALSCTTQLPRYRRLDASPNLQVDSTINDLIQQAADNAAIDRANLYKVYVCNLSYAGPAHGGMMVDICRTVAAKVTGDPDRSVALIILPNTGVHGSTGSNAFLVAQRAVTQMFEDPSYMLEVRDFVMMFDKATMYSKIRALVHPGLMIFSSTKFDKGVEGVGGEFRCHFRESELYWRRAVLDISTLERDQFVNPTSVPTIDGKPGRLSEAAEAKQHISGVGLYSKAGCVLLQARIAALHCMDMHLQDQHCTADERSHNGRSFSSCGPGCR